MPGCRRAIRGWWRNSEIKNERFGELVHEAFWTPAVVGSLQELPEQGADVCVSTAALVADVGGQMAWSRDCRVGSESCRSEC